MLIRDKLPLKTAPEFADQSNIDNSSNSSSSNSTTDTNTDKTDTTEWPPLDRFRLRFYNLTTKAVADAFSITQDGEKPLDTLGISAYRHMLLETRKVDEVWQEYFSDGVSINVEEYDPDNDRFLPARSIRLKKFSTCSDLLDSIAAFVPYPRDEILLMKSRPSTYQDVQIDIIIDCKKRLKEDMFLGEYSKVIFEHMPMLGQAAAKAEEEAARKQVELDDADMDENNVFIPPVLFNRTSFVTTFSTLNESIINVPQHEPAHYSKALKCHLALNCRWTLNLNKPPSTTFSVKLFADTRWNVGRSGLLLFAICFLV